MVRPSEVRDKVREQYDAIPPGKIVTVSNLISLSRAFLTGPIIYFLQRGQSRAAFIIILVAIISDILDGWLARINNAITEIGKVLDPVADAIVILSVTLYLLSQERIPAFYFFILIIRYFLIAIIGIIMLNWYGISPQANKLGKITVVFTAAAVLSVIYRDKVGTISIPLLWVSTGFLVVSGVWYIFSFLAQIIEQRKKIKRG